MNGVAISRFKQFESTNHAFDICWRYQLGALWVTLVQFTPQPFGAMFCGECIPVISDRIIDLLAIGELIGIDGCAYVKASTTSQNATFTL